MSRLILHYQPKDSASSRTDDVTIVNVDEDYPEFFHITHNPADVPGSSFEYSMSEYALLDHIEDILTGLSHDSDPYEYVQVTTNIGPPILYHVSDLDFPEARKNLLRIVRTALRTLTTQVKRSKRTA